jgi:hypothetical protein
MNPDSSRKRNKKPDSSYSKIEELLTRSAFYSSAPRADFRHELLSSLKAARRVPKETLMSRFFHLVYLPAAIAILMLVIAGGSLYFMQQGPVTVVEQPPVQITDIRMDPVDVPGILTLKPTENTQVGVAATTAFVLETTQSFSEAQIKKSLTISEGVRYAISKNDQGAYLIQPDRPLSEGSLVRVDMPVAYTTLKDESASYTFSWAFQVRETFQAVSTLPRHQSRSVPTNSGIEVEFSHAGFTGYEENFSIEPSVEGRFEVHNKTLSFIPETALSNITLYTVTIGKDLKLPATGETLGRDIVFQFETEPAPEYWRDPDPYFQKLSNESSTEDAPALVIFGDEKDTASDLTVTVYAFPSEETFRDAFAETQALPIWSWGSNGAWTTPTDGLSKDQTFTTKLKNSGEGTTLYLEFTKPMERGYYLVSMKSAKGDDIPERQTLLQINNLTSYAAVSDTDTLLWLHDAKSQEPVSQATVTLFDGTKVGTSDAKGLATFPTPDAVRTDLSETASSLVVESGDENLYLSIRPQPRYYMESAFWGDPRPVNPIRSEYWDYLYLNQPFYQPNDTVKFWGIARHRKDPETQTVEVRLYQGMRWFFDDRVGQDRVPLATQTIETDDAGMFQGELPLDHLFPSSYSLEVYVNGQLLTGERVTVETYTKPAYQLDIDSNVVALFSGDKVDYSIRATFFEGTPLPQLPLKYESEKPLVTNDVGVATVSETYQNSETYDRYVLATFQAARQEEGEISAEQLVRVFPSQHEIEATATEDDGTAEVSGKLFNIDLEPYNRGEVPLHANPTGPAVPNAKIEMELVKTWYETIQTGTRYDYLQKKVTPIYRYEPHQETVTTTTATTDKNGNFVQKFDVDEEFNYQVKMASKDSKGRVRTKYVYLSHYEPYDRFTRNQNLTLKIDQPDLGYAVGDPVTAELWKGDARIPDAKDGEPFLFLQAQGGIQEFTVSGSSSNRFQFAEDDVPNVELSGIWFDGRSYQQTSMQSLEFNPEGRKLTITATPDRDTYAAGDHVQLTIETKDANGTPRSAAVNVNLVDEALYQLKDTTLNFLSQLYHSVDDGMLTTAISHEYPSQQKAFLEGDGMGGGGDRAVFKDAPVFETIRTGSDGNGILEFDLPDNLTTWRATLHGYTSDLYAGNSTGAIVVKQPFFVDGIIAKSFHLNDQPVIRLRTYGEELKSGADVKIVVSSPTLPMAETSFNSQAFEPVDVELPGLTEGSHELRIAATSGALSDTLVRTFTVVSSNFMLPQTTVEEAAVGWKPSVETTRNFSILFVDKQIGQYYQPLEQTSYSWSDRFDDKISLVLAVKLLKEYFDEEGREVTPIEYEQYQNGTKGGLTLFPYSDDDLVLSAHVASSSEASSFNRDKLAVYFSAVWADETQTTLRRAQALYGLAGLEEPVLLDIRTMLASDDITDEDRLYLGLGLATLGDLEGARSIFLELETKYGKTQDQYEWLALGENQDQWLTATALDAILAAFIADPSADQLFNYVEDNRAFDVRLTLPRLLFLEQRLPTLPQGSVKIGYEFNGEATTSELEKGNVLEIPLTPSTASTFKLTALEGIASAITTQIAPQDFNAMVKDLNVKIQRNYVVHGKVTKTFQENDLVEVHLTTDIASAAPDGTYQVTDLLPAGLKVVTQPYRWTGMLTADDLAYPYRIDHNSVSFRVGDGHHTIKYLARVVNQGSYMAEPALVQSFNAPSAQNITDPDTITIR